MRVLKKLFLGDVVAKGTTRQLRKLTTEKETPLPERIDGALTFSSPNSFTLRTSNTKKNWDGKLEYSTDTKTWNVWDGTTTLSADSGKLYLRGTGNTKITGSSSYNWVLTGDSISCLGNIENLLDYTTVLNGEHPTMSSQCYRSIFSGCKSLTTAPELPATTLQEGCYRAMFYGCTSLTTAPPELPATTLVDYCYYDMFCKCASLTIAPELPATILADRCYENMFLECKSLIQAPELPATTIKNFSYYNMFVKCTSLTTPPELPATILGEDCYYNMFNQCTSLTTAPELPAMTLAIGCYGHMFQGCTSLTTAPKLPATTLKVGCYIGMFYGCTGLTTIPELPANTLVGNCYMWMFYGCSKIKLSKTQTGIYQTPYRIPTSETGTHESMSLYEMFNLTGGTFTGEPLINTTYYTSNTVV